MRIVALIAILGLNPRKIRARQEVAAEQERETLGVDAIVLEAGCGNRLRLLGIREHRLMAELLKEIDEPPPGPRRFDRDGSLRRELREEDYETRGA